MTDAEVSSRVDSREMFTWVNVHRGRSEHEPHNHEMSAVSGVYYTSAPDSSASLRFLDPRGGHALIEALGCGHKSTPFPNRSLTARDFLTDYLRSQRAAGRELGSPAVCRGIECVTTPGANSCVPWLARACCDPVERSSAVNRAGGG